jgi:hypothetical protein
MKGESRECIPFEAAFDAAQSGFVPVGTNAVDASRETVDYIKENEMEQKDSNPR